MPKPSFWYKIHEAHRLKQAGYRSPAWQYNPKDAGYDFARQHGIPTPTVLHYCERPTELPWDTLPDEFTIKSVDGASAQGVLPLARTDGRYRDLLAAPDAEPLTAAEITDLLRQRNGSGLITRQLLIEELLRSDNDNAVLDIKLYCFHGRVGLVRQMSRTRWLVGERRMETRTRDFSPDGDDLGEAFVSEQGTTDSSLPVPTHLDQLVAAGELLSGAIPAPFVRLDFYERDTGIVFGEVTPQPGGDQHPRGDLDRALGEMWEQAEADLLTAQPRT